MEDFSAAPSKPRLSPPGVNAASLRYYFEGLIDVARTLGYQSVYCLVDDADELPLTSSDAAATYEMLRPLLTDLPTLETPGVAFKFLLWDKLGIPIENRAAGLIACSR